MNFNNSFNRVLVGAVTTMVATGAYAVQKNSNALPKGSCDMPVEVCCEEPAPGPFAFSYPKDVNLACPVDFYIYGAALAMQAKEDGLEFGVRDSDGIQLPAQYGEFLGFSKNTLDYDYNPGARFGMGFYLSHDSWTLDFDWTWLNITNYQSYGTANAETISPIWLPPIDPSSTRRATSAVWNGNYNTIDIRLGKPYHVSRYFIAKPHFGARAAIIDQHFSVHYDGFFNGQRIATHHANNDFWGVGARGGLETEWILGKGWELFGNVAGSMLFSKFDVNQHVALGREEENTGYDFEDLFYQNVPNVDIQVGVAWDKYFDKNKYRISIALAYEFHEWFDQLNLKRVYGFTNAPADYQWQYETTARGNLTLNGFSLKLQLDI